MNPSQRHKARHFAMQAIYQWQITRELPSVIENQFIEDQPLGNADREYLHDLIFGTVTNVDEIDATFSPYLSRGINDLDMVDKAILRLATFELLHKQDVPYRVVINEAIMLAKEFAAQDSHKFVNGVLDRVVKNLPNADEGQPA
ncbi:MAG: transcription antitermination factor NusB [Succinivibrionaceae bacterium]|nr:transcription antitermination factor NusB [Succinivibrionaceae bacterium]